jgi:carboxyl-terminal processing protease
MLFLITSLAIIINPSLGTKYLNSSTDYQNFKQFLKTPKYSFETETEIALKTLWL